MHPAIRSGNRGGDARPQKRPCNLAHGVRPGCHAVALALWGTLVQQHGVSLGVTGSPCNPFSTFRTKRFADGSVSAHSMTDTTMASVIRFYQKFEPRAGNTEQVKGFGMRTSSEDKTTPLNLSLCLVCCHVCYVIVIDCHSHRHVTHVMTMAMPNLVYC